MSEKTFSKWGLGAAGVLAAAFVVAAGLQLASAPASDETYQHEGVECLVGADTRGCDPNVLPSTVSVAPRP